MLLLLVFGYRNTHAQFSPRESDNEFAWEVKQVDEFIERFNDDDEAMIKEYNARYHAQVELNREKLLKSLFNSANKAWNISEVKAFISEVDNKEKPLHINFYDWDWCAKVNCTVIWNKKPENVMLTLRVEKQADESSKWVITGVDAKFLKPQRLKDSISRQSLRTLPQPINRTTSLHPYSHSLAFMNISQVSKDKGNIANYFYQPADKDAGKDELLTFVNEIMNNRLTIKTAQSIKYQFFQIKGWAFEVQQFNRATRNSGWLISKLTKLS